jgi:HEAT repeat protein
MNPRWIIDLPDVEARRKAVANLRSTVQCGMADWDERDISDQIEALTLALFDDDTTVRAVALEAIHSAARDSQDVTPALPAVQRILESKTHDLRPGAAAFLVTAVVEHVKIGKLVPLLRRLIRDSDQAVRQDATRALVRWLAYQRQWAELRPLLEHPDDATRQTALRALLRVPGARNDFGIRPLLPTLVRGLAAPTPNVRHAAALAVVESGGDQRPFEATCAVLAASLADPRNDFRKEAALALREAVRCFLLVRRGRVSRAAAAALAPLTGALAARVDDESPINMWCTETLTRILSATRAWEEIQKLLQRMTTGSSAMLLAALGERTPQHGDSLRACRGPGGIDWTELEPLLPTVERCARRTALRRSATGALFQIRIHRGQWESAIALLDGASTKQKVLLLRELASCRARPCGAIDALIPTLLGYLVPGTGDPVSSAAWKAILDYMAPGAYISPWRGDLSFTEQARRAQVVLEAITAARTSLDKPRWDLTLRAKAIVHADTVAKLKGTEGLERFVQHLSHDNVQVRVWAAHRLGEEARMRRHSMDPAISALAACLEHDEPGLRAEAAEALGQASVAGVDVSQALPALLHELKEERIDPLRAIMARAVGMVAESSKEREPALAALARGLNDPDSGTRANCFSALMTITGSHEGARPVLGAVGGASLQSNDEVRRVLERCLQRLKGPKQVNLERIVKRAVRRALKAVEGQTPGIVTHLVSCLRNPDELRVHLAFQDRAARDEAKASGHQERIHKEVVAALKEEGYPQGQWTVDFVSVEEVDAAGGPSQYFR